MRRLLQILGNTDRPVADYVWRAGLIALIPSLAISALVALVLPHSPPPLKGSTFGLLVQLLVLSPWLETLLMWPLLWVLKRLVGASVGIAGTSAVCWGVLHSLAAPTWGLVVAWPFFVFSLCFLAWERKSTRRAIVATALVHTCQNLLPTIVLVVTQ